jgi:hypothetical protein
LLFPEFSIDSVTLILAAVAVLPWVMPLVKSLELPGGFKIELQDVKEATEKVVHGSVGVSLSDVKATATGIVLTPNQQVVERLKEVAANDGNLALVGAGIELEKRLLRLAETRGLNVQRLSFGQLLREIEGAKVLPSEVITGLRDLVALRNRAAHGTPVSPEAADWVLDILPSMLETIDRFSQDPK